MRGISMRMSRLCEQAMITRLISGRLLLSAGELIQNMRAHTEAMQVNIDPIPLVFD